MKKIIPDSLRNRAFAALMAAALVVLAGVPFTLATQTASDSNDDGVVALPTAVNEPFTKGLSVSYTDPATGEVKSAPSNSFRIPSMVTLSDGTIVAAADVRWNTTYDGGGLDTLVARSTDGGATWAYTTANYLGDNGNAYNAGSTSFIDPCLTVAADGQTVYMLVDLYPHGVALNGNGSQVSPSLETGFSATGNLLLSDNNRKSYDYYLKNGEICSLGTGQTIEGYAVDGYFNLYSVDDQGAQTYVSNLFFADSPFKVVRTGFLYLTKSVDGGASWSEPELLNLKTSSEQVCLVGPGRGVTTSDGIIAFPVYSYGGNQNSQRVGCVYSTDGGATWNRSTSNVSWSSEAAVVEVGEGTLRFFYRNGTAKLCYVDFNLAAGTWGSAVDTGFAVNSNTQLSAITYSKTIGGKQVVLVSCPLGPVPGGSSNNNGVARLNGHILAGVVGDNGEMTWTDAANISGTEASSQLYDDAVFTAEDGFFAYSCLTERADGSVAVLYENHQNGWGAGDDKYFAMDMKVFDPVSDLGLALHSGKVVLKDGLTTAVLYADPETDASDSIEVDADLLDGIYYIADTCFGADGKLYYELSCCVNMEWPEECEGYSYIRIGMVEETDRGIAFPIVDFTNAAPIARQSETQDVQEVDEAPQADAAAFSSRARLLSSVDEEVDAVNKAVNGLALDKQVKDNGDGTYEVTLEAYTTGKVTISQVTKPMDIVLVIDQSGSMAFCIECGNNMTEGSTHQKHTYNAVNSGDIRTNGTYYIKQGSGYARVYYCGGGSGYNAHAAGWYTESHNYNHWSGDRVSDGEQFYTRTTTNESCTRRYDALVDSLDGFVSSVKEKSVGPNGEPIDHRVAIVGFSSGDYNNTELLTGVTITEDSNTSIANNNTKHYPKNKAYNGVQYGNISTTQYQNALQDVSTSEGYENVQDAIDALTAHGGTQTLDGMDMAYNILQNNTKKNEDREQVVILFTDGATNSNRGNLLNKSHDIKNMGDMGATVYSIGIFDGADGSLSSVPDDINDDNDLMHLISSNYPDAYYQEAMQWWEEGDLTVGDKNPLLGDDDSYYLSASNADALSEIFKSISSAMGSSSSDLDASAVVKDIVTSQFMVPENASNVEVFQLPYTGTGDNWGSAEPLDSSRVVTVDSATNTVNVTGFDFKHNFVANTGRIEGNLQSTGDFYGRKLRIVFTVTVDPDFLGGSGVPTNGEGSGIYAGDGTLAGSFERPVFDIPIKKISTEVQDRNVYLGNATDLTDILNLYVKRDDQNTDLRVTVDGVNNAYVNLLYTVKLGDEAIATYSIPAGKSWGAGEWSFADGAQSLDELALTEDAQFSVTCEMTEKSYVVPGNGATPDPKWYQTASDEGSVFIYKPVVVFQDASKMPGTDYVDYDNDNYVSVAWKHGDTSSEDVSMEGAEPTLTYTYVPDADCVDGDGLVVSSEDFHVNVTEVKATNAKGVTSDIVDSVVFEHKDCASDCSYDPAKGEFMIHIPLTSLTITKSVANAKAGETFVFKVNGSDGFATSVVIAGSDSVTIEGLPIGSTYTVAEDTAWSWQYKLDSVVDSTAPTNDGVITLSADATDNVVIFTNSSKTTKWLSFSDWAKNLFSGNGIKITPDVIAN